MRVPALSARLVSSGAISFNCHAWLEVLFGFRGGTIASFSHDGQARNFHLAGDL